MIFDILSNSSHSLSIKWETGRGEGGGWEEAEGVWAPLELWCSLAGEELPQGKTKTLAISETQHWADPGNVRTRFSGPDPGSHPSVMVCIVCTLNNACLFQSEGEIDWCLIHSLPGRPDSKLLSLHSFWAHFSPKTETRSLFWIFTCSSTKLWSVRLLWHLPIASSDMKQNVLLHKIA